MLTPRRPRRRVILRGHKNRRLKAAQKYRCRVSTAYPAGCVEEVCDERSPDGCAITIPSAVSIAKIPCLILKIGAVLPFHVTALHRDL